MNTVSSIARVIASPVPTANKSGLIQRHHGWEGRTGDIIISVRLPFVCTILLRMSTLAILKRFVSTICGTASGRVLRNAPARVQAVRKGSMPAIERGAFVWWWSGAEGFHNSCEHQLSDRQTGR